MLRYMIVDDEPLIRQGIQVKIDAEPLGLEFAGEAEDGDDALFMIRHSPPDILLLDMKMPGMDGVSLLRVVHQEFPDIRVIIISGYSDFEYTRCAIEHHVSGYLLKPFAREQINALLADVTAGIRSARAEQVALDALKEAHARIQASTDVQSLVGLITSPSTLRSGFQVKSAALSRILTSSLYALGVAFCPEPLSDGLFESAIRLADAEKFCSYLPFDSNPHQHLLLFFSNASPEVFSWQLRQSAEALFATLSETTPSDFFMAASQYRDTADGLHPAYLECMSLFESRPLSAHTGLFVSDGKPRKPSVLQWHEEDALLFYMESGNEEQVRAGVGRLTEMIASIPDITPRNIRDILNSLVHSTMQLLGRHNIEADPGFFSQVARETRDFIRTEQIHSALLACCLHVTGLFSHQPVYSEGHLTENIRRYVQGNYHKNLSLEHIAGLFFVNPSYCSYIFKSRTGENLSDFINSTRIRKACELLVQSPQPIAGIARSVGFNNPNYFYKVFKQYTGATPWEYRTRTPAPPETP